ncbi:PREDICTED: uncharacterized protein LOC105117239 isoform X2 [Populus euphratica]|uniref:Uncharacterized protein LOC105117239 isoform X2 n=1 Tax=Populus euphratica TaxID=75702 RepID=A0AAJ6TLQ1_POPEU|nr:PREDICTED: uncharacterized protein LOC105117239 isoform X2 [Populus euphratica]
MEGMGSRMGRTSSRYGLSATATVFNGPVRKWKRKWVHVSPSPTLNYRNNNHSNGHNDQNNNGSRLLLCRWTPLSPAAATSTTTEDPPKRKFRYTPERSKEEKKAEQEVEKQSGGWQTAKNGEQNDEDDFKSVAQDSNLSHLDLGLCLKGRNIELDSVCQSEEDQVKRASSGGLWAIG